LLTSEKAPRAGHGREFWHRRSSGAARAVLYIVSDEATYLTATTLFIDGGMTLYSSFLGES
jgi:NAD(P)-dependent dehydrogenase (short-subunit alcohol dehydrogenase family)